MQGCTSKFSRQDNMMQHYRTHLSSKSRRGSKSGIQTSPPFSSHQPHRVSDMLTLDEPPTKRVRRSAAVTTTACDSAIASLSPPSPITTIPPPPSTAAATPTYSPTYENLPLPNSMLPPVRSVIPERQGVMLPPIHTLTPSTLPPPPNHQMNGENRL
ncbi:7603_t:CDS:1, partial [Acaulospora colombiana]